MTRRPRGLFRGTEFPRLIFLIAIVLVGWPMVLLFARPRADEPPPPPLKVAASLPPVTPDTGVEFGAVQDKQAVTIKESAAYSILLHRVRDTSPGKLAADARHDVFFTHLWDSPEKFRGVPVHLAGRVVRALAHPVNENLASGKQLYEAWIYTDENPKFPDVLIFEEPPAGFPVGANLNLNVTFDGYFFKLLRYEAGDGRRAAPMLVGRLYWTPPATTGRPPIVDTSLLTRRNLVISLVVVLVTYIAIRVALVIHRILNPRREPGPRTGALSEGQIAPADLSRWLQDLPDEPPALSHDD